MDPSKLEVGEYVSSNERLGRGSFAMVYKGYHKVSKTPVAVKIIDLDKLATNNPKLLEHMRLEIEIMKGLKHDNIVELLDFRIESHFIYMVLEYCAGGDFAKLLQLQPEKRLSERHAKFFLRQLATGLRFLRSKKIIHRDLKPQNLLMSSVDLEHAVLKITDFGFAKLIEREQSGAMLETLCGTPLYMAPEILRLEPYDIKADLWSVGVILWEMLAGKLPFRARTPFELPHVIQSTTLVMDPSLGISAECSDLLQHLLQKDSSRRLCWEEFFLHPFLGFSPTPTPSPGTSPMVSSSPMSGLSQLLSSGAARTSVPGSTPTAPTRPTQYGFLPSHPNTKPTPSPTQPISQPVRPDPLSRERANSTSATHKSPPSHLQSLLTRSSDTMRTSSKSMEGSAAKSATDADKDFVIVPAGGEAQNPIPATEEALLAEGSTRESRAHVLVEMADNKMEQALPAEAVVLYLKYMDILKGVVLLCHQVCEHRKWPMSAVVKSFLDRIQMRFSEVLNKCRTARQHLKPTDLLSNAEKLVFEQALSFGREAAVDEMLSNFRKAEYFYGLGIQLLELLQVDATDPADTRILREYISRFALRLQETARKRDIHVYDKPTDVRR